MMGFTAQELPNGMIDTYLVASAAMATVRLDRSARNEFAVIAKKRRDAKARWRQRQVVAAAKVAAGLEEDPETTVETLFNTSAGCDRLLDGWDDLALALEADGCWNFDQAQLALRLLGRDPGGVDDDEGNPIRLAILAARFELDAGDQPGPESCPTAFGTLKALVDGERARIEKRSQKVLRDQDLPALGEAIDRATIDTSPKGVLRRRYESAASLDMHKAFDRIAKRQRAEKANTNETPKKHRDPAPHLEQADNILKALVTNPPRDSLAPEPDAPAPARPVAQPVAPPVAQPVAPPVGQPVAPPVAKPAAAPVAPPVAPPVSQPAPPPIAPPVRVQIYDVFDPADEIDANAALARLYAEDAERERLQAIVRGELQNEPLSAAVPKPSSPEEIEAEQPRADQPFVEHGQAIPDAPRAEADRQAESPVRDPAKPPAVPAQPQAAPEPAPEPAAPTPTPGIPPSGAASMPPTTVNPAAPPPEGPLSDEQKEFWHNGRSRGECV
jgi:hypothetical protein